MASGTCGAQGDNLTWTLTPDGTLTISGKGAMEDYRDFSDVPWYAYREHIRTAVLADDVTSIGNCAFANCRKLTSVHISDGVTSIGSWAFEECSGLLEIRVEAVVPPPVMGVESFEKVSKSIPVYVPAESIEAYQNSKWGEFFSNIQPM